MENVDEIYLNNSNSKQRFSGTFFIDFQKKKLFKKNEILRGAKLQFTFSRKRERVARATKKRLGQRYSARIKKLDFLVLHTQYKNKPTFYPRPKKTTPHRSKKQRARQKSGLNCRNKRSASRTKRLYASHNNNN